MTLPRRLKSRVSRRPFRRRPPEVEAAARARRARDHLARQRDRDRRRLARERSLHARTTLRRGRLRMLGAAAFVLAAGLGTATAPALVESWLLRMTRLERVAVQGAHAIAAESVAARAGVFLGQPLRALDQERLAEAFHADPWIASVRTLRLPGGTLVVSVEERRAIARWRTDAALPLELLDASGRPFPGALEPAGEIPLVVGAVDATGVLPEPALEILTLLGREQRLAARAAELVLHLPETDTGEAEGTPGYVLELGPHGPRVLLGREHFARRIARLVALLDAEGPTARATSWIDLRYADRAVLRNEPASG